MRYLLLGLLMWWIVPAWALVIVIVLIFMHGATRKPTPKRRR